MRRLLQMGAMALALIGCGGGGGGGGTNAPRLPVVAVTTDGRVVRFDLDRPSDLQSEATITGLGAGQNLVGIDRRPANGAIVVVSNTGVVYTLNVATGAATAVGADAVSVDAAAGAFDIDFNPQVDRIRLGNASDQNIRINPDTGVQVDGDGDGSNGVQGDTNFNYENGQSAQIVGLAYTNSVAGATSTVLYAIDRAQGRLDVLNSTTSTPTGPNGGRLVPVGSLGLSISDLAPFDITSDNATAVIAVGDGERSRIATLNLSTGRASVVGRTPVGLKVVGFCFVPT